MVHQYRPNFPHRFNADGSYDSICTLCHVAIATVRIEAELSQHEHNHKCSQGVSTRQIALHFSRGNSAGKGATCVTSAERNRPDDSSDPCRVW